MYRLVAIRKFQVPKNGATLTMRATNLGLSGRLSNQARCRFRWSCYTHGRSVASRASTTAASAKQTRPSTKTGRGKRAPDQQRSIALKLNQHIVGLEDPKKLLDVWKENSNVMNGVNIATTFSRLGRAPRPRGKDYNFLLDPLFVDMCRSTVLLIKSGALETRQQCNIVHALAKLGCHAKLVFNAVAAKPDKLASEGNPQNLANAVWAFATMGRNDRQLFDSIADQAKRLATEGNPQNLANAVWAFATVGRSDRQLFDAIAGQAKRLAKDGNPQNISNTVWAFATVGRHDPELFDAIADQATRIAESNFNPQNLSNIAWAYARAGRNDPPLFAAIAGETKR